MTSTPSLIVMGVSGSGKSTIGRALADELQVDFVDGDDLHPVANKEKMAAGHPLDDDDRASWLEAIANLIGSEVAAGRAIVVACSALKRRYRSVLIAHAPQTVFVHLELPRELVVERTAARVHEFMPTTLIDSQFEALEPLEADERGILVDAGSTPQAIVEAVRLRLSSM